MARSTGHGESANAHAGSSRSRRERDPPDDSQDEVMEIDGDEDEDAQPNGTQHSDARPSPSQPKSTARSMFQNATEKRELRKNYRTLMAIAEDARKDIADQTSSSLTTLLKQTDDLYNKVKAPSEGILDARVLNQMVDIGTHIARTMKTNADAFDTDSFLTRAARLMGGQIRAAGRRAGETLDDEDAAHAANEWDWDALGRIAAKHSRRAVTMDFLHGPLQTRPKERKQVERTKKPKEKVGAAVRPEELKENDIQRSENETTVMVRQIANLLEEVGEVNLFNFIVDPTSFSNTVENLFYVSFLIRDGKVSLDTENDEGEPILMRAEPPREEDYAQGLAKRQLVMEFDMKVYQDIIETYGITESIIPSRKEVKKESQSNRWYG